MINEEERYAEMGGVYFPILQQDGTRVLTKVSQADDVGALHYLQFLRQQDR